MIDFIELTNFKSIKNNKFLLKNLNVVMGLNGMGKSSFIQSVLLLRQSSNLQNGELRLNDELVNIGKGKDAFYQYSKGDRLIFDIGFTNNVNYEFVFPYVSEADYFIANTGNLNFEDFFDQSLFTNKFQYLSAFRLEPKVIHDKSYSSVVNKRSLGTNGEYTIHFLEVYGKDDICFDNLIHPNSQIDLVQGKEIVDKTILSQVNNWLGEISPGVILNTDPIPNSDNILLDFQYKQQTLGRTNKFRPTNVGFGITYSLPVVTALLSANPGDLIVIENPESHIHPRGQAELGKLIALTAMNDVQIIVETHSDHILNGIRVAVKEESISYNRAKLFYFERQYEETEQFSKVTNIYFDKNGELSEYPDNLLDEWSNQLLKLV